MQNRDPLTGPAKGGPEWLEITSPHFVMNTDVGEGEAKDELTAYEHFYEALRSVVKASDQAERTRLVLFERSVDYAQFTDIKREVGHFLQHLPGDPESMPTLVFSSERQDLVHQIFLHELGHRFNHRRFFFLPIWLDEGMADYASTLVIDGAEVRLGGPNPKGDFVDQEGITRHWDPGYSHQIMELPAKDAPTLTTLMNARRIDFYGDTAISHYLASWKIIQLLENGPDKGDRARFDATLGEIEKGTKAADAFSHHFDVPALEKRARAYLLARDLPTESFPSPPSTKSVPSMSVRKLADGEVHLLWGELATRPALARDQLELASSSDAPSAEIHYARASMYVQDENLRAAQHEIDQALATAPDDPRFIALRLRLDGRERERAKKKSRSAEPWALGDDALAERLEMSARTPYQLETLASLRLETGHPDAALALSERAIKVDPLCNACFLTHSLALANNDRLEEAVAALDRAMTLWPEGDVPESIRAWQKRLGERAAKKREGGGDKGAEAH